MKSKVNTSLIMFMFGYLRTNILGKKQPENNTTLSVASVAAGGLFLDSGATSCLMTKIG